MDGRIKFGNCKALLVTSMTRENDSHADTELSYDLKQVIIIIFVELCKMLCFKRFSRNLFYHKRINKSLLITTDVCAFADHAQM